MVRTVLSSALLIAKVLLGSVAIVFSNRNWFVVAFGPFMFAHAFMALAFNESLTPVRGAIGISSTTAMKLYAASHFLAGAFALFGCLTLAPLLAVIAAILIVGWMGVWGFVLQRLRRTGTHF